MVISVDTEGILDFQIFISLNKPNKDLGKEKEETK